MVDLASVIRPGDGILWGQACAEPRTLVEALLRERSQLSGCGVFLGSSYSGLVRPEHADHLRLTSYCGTGSNRALADAGVLEILPAPYSQFGFLIRNRTIRCDVAMVQVSPPNARGEFSLKRTDYEINYQSVLNPVGDVVDVGFVFRGRRAGP